MHLLFFNFNVNELKLLCFLVVLIERVYLYSGDTHQLNLTSNEQSDGMPPTTIAIGRGYTSFESQHSEDGHKKSIFRTNLEKARRYTLNYKEGEAPRIPVTSGDPWAAD